MAESGERGLGRMAEPLEIVAAVDEPARAGGAQPLAGKRVLVTSGPTHEPIDPVRYIANRSSGKQGHAIAAAAARAGAEVTLVQRAGDRARSAGRATPSTSRPRARCCAPSSARCRPMSPIFAAAVADWRVANAGVQKIKKDARQARRRSRWPKIPDILSTVAHRKARGRGW